MISFIHSYSRKFIKIAGKSRSAIKTARTNFAIKDYISLAISLFALVIASLGFYFSNVRVNDGLNVKVIDMNPLSRFKPSAKQDSILITLLYNNIGNRQEILLSPQCVYQASAKSRLFHGMVRLENSQNYPVILEPHQVKIIPLRIPYDALKEHRGRFTGRYNGVNNYLYFLRLVYFAINSESKQTVTYSDMVIEARVADSTFKSVDVPFDDLWLHKPTVIF